MQNVKYKMIKKNTCDGRILPQIIGLKNREKVLYKGRTIFGK